MPAPEAARRPAHIALFDATTLVAKGVKDLLVARSFPAASVRLFTSSTDPDSNLTEFAGEAMLVTTPDLDTLGHLDIAFLCGDRAEGERYVDWASRSGFYAIDLSRAAGGPEGATPINAAVNPDALPRRPGAIPTPHPASQMLSTLLAPIRSACGLRDVLAVVLLPASQRGEPGIDELYQQSLSLMNFKEMPREIFGRQLAFNLIPAAAAGPPLAARGDLEREVRRITGGDYGISLQAIQAPVFHGHAAMVHVALDEGKGRDDLLDSFRGVAEIQVARPGGKVTPVERAGEGGLLVGSVEPGLGRSSFWIWAVTDDLAGGTTLNAVRIAEILLERGLERGPA